MKLLLFLLLSISCAATELNFKLQLLHRDNNEGSAIADYNKDGHLDISAGEFWYAGPDFKSKKQLRKLGKFGKDYMTNNGEHSYDVDGDGWVDIIAGSFKETELFWYKNPGKDGLEKGELWEKKLIAKTTNQNEITYIHDFNGDGKPEYIANSWNARVPQKIWFFTFNQSTPTIKAHQIGKFNGHGIGFGDVNNDGHEDILISQGWYERPKTEPFTKEWTFHKDWNIKQASCPMIVTDLNKDGLNDFIVGLGHNYGLYWMEKLKDGKWKKHEIDKSISQLHAIAYVDIDNDGEKEIITGKRVRAHSGKDPGANDKPMIVYYKLDQKTMTFKRHLIMDDIGTGLFIRAVDLTKNGYKDLVLAGKGGTHIVYNLGKK